MTLPKHALAMGVLSWVLAADAAAAPPDPERPAERSTEPTASAEKTQEPAAADQEPGVLLDRAAVRFTAPEGAGRERPYFIYERELAFEARLMALSDASHRARVPYRRHHLQAAMERHIAETLLAANAMEPAPTPVVIEKQMAEAKTMLLAEVGGERALIEAARAEGLDSLELRRLYRRRALASLYLDRMVTPMLAPSLLSLRRAHRRGEGPLADRPFAEAEAPLRRWYIAQSLRNAVATYYQNARARLTVRFL